MRTGHWLIIGVLFGLLAATVAYGVNVWAATSPMSTHVYVVIALGTLVAIVIGVGLMALMFYSNRKGYDDAANKNQKRRK